MKISHLNAFSDNYMWTMESDGKFAIVDPGDAKPVHQYIEETGFELVEILVTHHHWDHSGGIDELVTEYDCLAYGPSGGHIKGITNPLKDNETFIIQNNIEVKAFSAPGHTDDQLSYFIDEAIDPILFSGDTLFSAGCGRLFEGSPEDMLFSMDRYTDLPPNTLVYCGHEYTESNLRFALAVEPGNKDIELRIKEVGELRNSNQPSLPSNIETELKINPFLRCREANVIKAAQNYSSKQLDQASDVLGEIRNWKDNF